MIIMKSKEIKKKLFSLLLVVTVISSLGPVNASAATKPAKVKSVKAKEVQKSYKGWSGEGNKKTKVKYKAMQLSWKKVKGAAGYVVYRYGNASKVWHQVKVIKSPKTTSYIVPECSKGSKVKLKVAAYKKVSGQRVYGTESKVISFKPKRNYELTGTVKTKKYNRYIPKGWYRFVSEDAFVIQNKYRTTKGVAPLKWSEAVYEMAKIRSKEATIKVSHTRPNGKGCRTVVEDYLGAKVSKDEISAISSFAENLHWGGIWPQKAMKSWKNSPGHYRNLLSSSHTNGAISFYWKDDGDNAWCANFTAFDFDNVKKITTNNETNETS